MSGSVPGVRSLVIPLTEGGALEPGPSRRVTLQAFPVTFSRDKKCLWFGFPAVLECKAAPKPTSAPWKKNPRGSGLSQAATHPREAVMRALACLCLHSSTAGPWDKVLGFKTEKLRPGA